MKINKNTVIGDTNYSLNDAIDIVESGENNYGRYIKYRDGTMICYRRIHTSFNCNIPWGSLYAGVIQDRFYFAKEFIESPVVSITVRPDTSSGCWYCGWEYEYVLPGWIENLAVVRPSLVNGVSANVNIIAIGKWK